MIWAVFLKLDTPLRKQGGFFFHLKQDGVTTGKVIDSLGMEQNATLINEQNLYKVIFQSLKEEAEQLLDWMMTKGGR